MTDLMMLFFDVESQKIKSDFLRMSFLAVTRWQHCYTIPNGSICLFVGV